MDNETKSILKLTNVLLVGVIIMLGIVAFFIYLADRHNHAEWTSFFNPRNVSMIAPIHQWTDSFNRP